MKYFPLLLFSCCFLVRILIKLPLLNVWIEPSSGFLTIQLDYLTTKSVSVFVFVERMFWLEICFSVEQFLTLISSFRFCSSSDNNKSHIYDVICCSRFLDLWGWVLSLRHPPLCPTDHKIEKIGNNDPTITGWSRTLWELVSQQMKNV